MNGQLVKTYWKKVAVVLIAVMALAGVALWADMLPSKTLAPESSGASEQEAILQVARDYLDAEVRREHKAVYASFAPSSAYMQTHSYEAYLKEAKAAADHLIAYTIVEVSFIHDNEDREKWPDVDKIAQVVVDVTFLHVPTDRQSDVNVGFIFFKEGGRWYKS